MGTESQPLLVRHGSEVHPEDLTTLVLLLLRTGARVHAITPFDDPTGGLAARIQISPGPGGSEPLTVEAILALESD